MHQADDTDHLQRAFESVYLDLCGHGICAYDPFILDRLWRDFLIDMAHGFPSLTEKRQ